MSVPTSDVVRARVIVALSEIDHVASVDIIADMLDLFDRVLLDLALDHIQREILVSGDFCDRRAGPGDFNDVAFMSGTDTQIRVSDVFQRFAIVSHDCYPLVLYSYLFGTFLLYTISYQFVKGFWHEFEQFP